MKVTDFLREVYYQFKGFRCAVLDKGGDIKGSGFGRHGVESHWYLAWDHALSLLSL